VRWTEGVVDAGGVDIHYVRTGDGSQPPVVLIHGFTDNGRCWERVALAIESAFDVVMIDSRNHGESSAAVGSCADMAVDVAALAAKLELAPTVVVGHSLGAITAAEFAAQHPELVTHLVLEDPPWRRRRTARPDKAASGTASTDARRESLQSFIDSFSGMSHDEIVEMGRSQHPLWNDLDFAAWGQSKQQVRPEAIESITRHDWAEVVPKLQCPTLLIHGEVELGGVVGGDVAAEVIALNPLVSSAEVAGTGHNVRREGFEAYLEQLRSFVSDS